MRSSQQTVVDLIRHGEPVGGSSRYRGQTDDPLSDKGWQQMRSAVADHRPWQAIISSPLSRCAAFARELSARHALPLEIEPRLKEIGFGAWEGRTREELEHENPGQVARFLADPRGQRPSGAEPLDEFRARVVGAWSDLLARHRGRHLLIVGHAGIIRMLVSHVLDAPAERVWRIQVPNAALTRIEVEHREQGLFPKLVFHAGSL